VLALGAIGAGGYALYAIGMRHGMGMAAVTAQTPAASAHGAASAAINESPEDATRRHIAAGLKAGDTDPATGKKILYYHDPMVPGNKFDRPAKSPFMEMMLYPVYGAGDADNSNVAVSPRIQQSLGVRTAPVTEGRLAPQVSAVGSIAWNERDQVVVQARATGFVEKLHVRATLDRVPGPRDDLVRVPVDITHGDIELSKRYPKLRHESTLLVHRTDNDEGSFGRDFGRMSCRRAGP
jgi:Cu(I)/Ag(I) efflux system membrane fusion protein